MNIKKKKVGERRRGEYIFMIFSNILRTKWLWFLCIIGLGVVSCEDPFPSFERDYHLIVTEGDSLLKYLPDTLGWIETIYGYEGEGEYYYITNVGEGQPILKRQLGSAIGDVVLDRGEPIFSLHCPSDVGPEETGIFVKVTSNEGIVFGNYSITIGDEILNFNINSVFSLDLNDVEADTLYEHGIPTHICKTEGGFGLICSSNRINKIKVY